MRGEEFIALAGRLTAATKAGPAEYRSAISRAYYGAYHAAVEFLKASGTVPPRDHGEVQRLLARSGGANALAASHFLSDLQSRRVRADYQLDYAAAETAAYAIQSVEMASDIQSQLRLPPTAKK
jgi:uncharacterized protein (UPF0332 family)